MMLLYTIYCLLWVAASLAQMSHVETNDSINQNLQHDVILNNPEISIELHNNTTSIEIFSSSDMVNFDTTQFSLTEDDSSNNSSCNISHIVPKSSFIDLNIDEHLVKNTSFQSTSSSSESVATTTITNTTNIMSNTTSLYLLSQNKSRFSLNDSTISSSVSSSSSSVPPSSASSSSSSFKYPELHQVNWDIFSDIEVANATESLDIIRNIPISHYFDVIKGTYRTNVLAEYIEPFYPDLVVHIEKKIMNKKSLKFKFQESSSSSSSNDDDPNRNKDTEKEKEVNSSRMVNLSMLDSTKFFMHFVIALQATETILRNMYQSVDGMLVKMQSTNHRLHDVLSMYFPSSISSGSSSSNDYNGNNNHSSSNSNNNKSSNSSSNSYNTNSNNNSNNNSSSSSNNSNNNNNHDLTSNHKETNINSNHKNTTSTTTIINSSQTEWWQSASDIKTETDISRLQLTLLHLHYQQLQHEFNQRHAQLQSLYHYKRERKLHQQDEYLHMLSQSSETLYLLEIDKINQLDELFIQAMNNQYTIELEELSFGYNLTCHRMNITLHNMNHTTTIRHDLEIQHERDNEEYSLHLLKIQQEYSQKIFIEFLNFLFQEIDKSVQEMLNNPWGAIILSRNLLVGILVGVFLWEIWKGIHYVGMKYWYQRNLSVVYSNHHHHHHQSSPPVILYSGHHSNGNNNSKNNTVDNACNHHPLILTDQHRMKVQHIITVLKASVNTTCTTASRTPLPTLLLIGPPGVGKSLAAVSIAQSAGFPYAVLRGADLEAQGSQAGWILRDLFADSNPININTSSRRSSGSGNNSSSGTGGRNGYHHRPRVLIIDDASSFIRSRQTNIKSSIPSTHTSNSSSSSSSNNNSSSSSNNNNNNSNRSNNIHATGSNDGVESCFYAMLQGLRLNMTDLCVILVCSSYTSAAGIDSAILDRVDYQLCLSLPGPVERMRLTLVTLQALTRNGKGGSRSDRNRNSHSSGSYSSLLSAACQIELNDWLQEVFITNHDDDNDDDDEMSGDSNNNNHHHHHHLNSHITSPMNINPRTESGSSSSNCSSSNMNMINKRLPRKSKATSTTSVSSSDTNICDDDIEGSSSFSYNDAINSSAVITTASKPITRTNRASKSGSAATTTSITNTVTTTTANNNNSGTSSINTSNNNNNNISSSSNSNNRSSQGKLSNSYTLINNSNIDTDAIVFDIKQCVSALCGLSDGWSCREIKKLLQNIISRVLATEACQLTTAIWMTECRQYIDQRKLILSDLNS